MNQAISVKRVHVNVKNELCKEIDVGTAVRQGDSLSPFLFNLIPEKIIKTVRATKIGYHMIYS